MLNVKEFLKVIKYKTYINGYKKYSYTHTQINVHSPKNVKQLLDISI